MHYEYFHYKLYCKNSIVIISVMKTLFLTMLSFYGQNQIYEYIILSFLIILQ